MLQTNTANEKRSQFAQHQVRDRYGHFINHDQPVISTPSTIPSKEDPPLISFKLTNPVTYFKSWWKRAIAGQGVDIHFKIHPFTAITLTAFIMAGSFTIGRITLPANSPIIKYIPQLASPDPWQNTAFTGILRLSSNKYYLATSDSQAITLEIPTNISLAKFVGKRIFAEGKFNKSTQTLIISEATDLEVLPTQAVLIPTTLPSPIPTLNPNSSPTPQI